LPKVVIAGATGFVGRALAAKLHAQYYLVGLSRVASRESARGPGASCLVDELRSCDLHSLLATENALCGAEYAYYLVHSMMPPTRLSQGDFWDFDLIAADNFARVASRSGIKQIIYLGGLVPSDDVLSRHLESRFEVEKTLAAHGVPVTALRAGMVIGAEGPSFLTMVKTVQKAPLILCPNWADTISHPIALEDVVHLLCFCLANESTFCQAFDVGGPELMSYRRMLQTIARNLGVKRPEIPFPFGATRLVQIGISLLSGAPRELIEPLVESLRHPIVARDRVLNQMADLPGIPYKDAIAKAVKEILATAVTGAPQPIAFQRSRVGHQDAPTVRSVQRFVLPPGKNAEWVVREYFAWLPTWLGFFLQVRAEGEQYSIALNLFKDHPLLIFDRLPDRSWRDRQVFLIKGGLLARDNLRGRAEFREVLGGTAVLAALHDFSPRLPWFLYVLTQAKLHLLVMKSFSRHLEKIASKEMPIGGFFSGLLKGNLSLAEIGRQRTAGRRLPRVEIEPLHEIGFQLESAENLLQIANISAGGIGFIRSSLERWPEPRSVIEGRLTIGGSSFEVKVKVVHASVAVVGVSFEQPPKPMVAKIREYLLAEISALDMVWVPRESLRDEPDGTPYWFHGTNNCELYFVTRMGRILRFHLVYFGHYLEGGDGKPLRYGYAVEERDDEVPGHKGPALVRWGKSINAENLSTAIRLLQNIRDLSPELRQSILKLIY
jgi:uncharacterized protein YbjT (DUF2867 family)